MTDDHAQQIVEQWLAQSIETATQKNLEEHMGMISKRVSVLGVPGFDNINYDIWYNQCQHQFDNSMIQSISYKGVKLLSSNQSQIIFTVFETVVGTDGTLNEQSIEMLLEKEGDEVWRLVTERVLNA